MGNFWCEVMQEIHGKLESYAMNISNLYNFNFIITPGVLLIPRT